MSVVRNPKIIGIVGPTLSGKSSAAKVLTNTYGYRLAPMAQPLKNMLITGGLTHADVYGEHKERPNVLLGGRTPRYAMQTLGTEWGRDLIHPDLWVNMWAANYETAASHVNPQPVVADDVRFDNEAEVIRNLGGIIVEICRPGAKYSTSHRSEKGIGVIDYRIHNTGNISDLRDKVKDVVEGREPRV